jgi:hypothetical protein
MPTLHPISGCENADRLLDVIFIHGFGGHHLNSWSHSETSNKKPLLRIPFLGKRGCSTGSEEAAGRDCMLDWLGKDLNGVGVWSLEHESKQKSYQRSLRLEEVVPGILDEIVNKQLGKRPYALIGHSYGGLIIKELLKESKSHDAYSYIHQACIYVCFLATPHLGSGWANFVKAIADPLLSQTYEDLETKNLHNSRLHQWFSSWIGERKMQDDVHSFIEYQDSGIVVVSRDSAYAGVGATKQTTLDHNGIAKPKDRDSDPYKTIRSKLDSLLGELSPVSEVPLAAHRSHPNQAGTKTEATNQKHDHTLVIAVVPSLHQMALEQEGERYMLRH